MKKTIILTVLLLMGGQVIAAGVVPPNTTQLGDAGTSSNPANWYLSGDYIAQSEFTIGHSTGNYNVLTVADGQTFTAESNLVVGPYRSDYNQLLINAGANVHVQGNLRIGTGHIQYYCTDNRIDVLGNLMVDGDFGIGSRTAYDGVLHIQDQGLVKVTGDFNLYSHWAYDNSWLELDGGVLALLGDKTVDFTEGSPVLGSIKVWSPTDSDFVTVADYTGSISSSTKPNAYSSMLDVQYVSDLADPLYGYTVLQAVPEPASIALLGFAGLVASRFRRS